MVIPNTSSAFKVIDFLMQIDEEEICLLYYLRHF